MLTVRVPLPLLKRLRGEAVKAKRTLSDYVRLILEAAEERNAA